MVMMVVAHLYACSNSKSMSAILFSVLPGVCMPVHVHENFPFLLPPPLGTCFDDSGHFVL